MRNVSLSAFAGKVNLSPVLLPAVAALPTALSLYSVVMTSGQFDIGRLCINDAMMRNVFSGVQPEIVARRRQEHHDGTTMPLKQGGRHGNVQVPDRIFVGCCNSRAGGWRCFRSIG
jgi:hypothetical protein